MPHGLRVITADGRYRLDVGDRQVMHYAYFSGYLASGNSAILTVGGGYSIGNGDWGLDVTPVVNGLKAISTNNKVTVTNSTGAAIWYRVNVFKLNQ